MSPGSTAASAAAVGNAVKPWRCGLAVRRPRCGRGSCARRRRDPAGRRPRARRSPTGRPWWARAGRGARRRAARARGRRRARRRSVAGSASRSSQRRTRRDEQRGVAQVGVGAHHHVVGEHAHLDDGACASGSGTTRRCAQPRRRARAPRGRRRRGRRGTPRARAASYGGRSRSRSTSARVGCGDARAPCVRRSCDGGDAELAAHDVVELPDAREARRERDLGERQVGLLDEQLRGLRAPADRELQRPGADLRDERAVHVTLAHVQRAREARDTRRRRRALGDQPQRARREVAAVVPVPRARGGVGSAPLARAEPGAHRRGRCGEEPHVLRLRRLRRAHRAAVDARARDAEPQPSVEAAVAARERR